MSNNLKQILLLFIATLSPFHHAQAAPLTYNDVAPIFLGRCMMCHMPNGIMGDPPENYRLDSYVETLSKSDRARVVPGNALASELYRRIKGYAKPRMPFNGPPFLSEVEVDRIAQWINDGARDANGNLAPDISGSRVRLHGQLTELWALDGLKLSIHSGTRIKKNPAIGSYVRVQGIVGKNAEIHVDRIKRR